MMFAGNIFKKNIIALAMAFPVTAFSASLYVDKGGHGAIWDGIDGHAYECPNGNGTGFSTIQAAMNAMTVGSTIFMRGGTYNETHIDMTYCRHGLPNAKNKISSYPGEWAVVDGQYANPSYYRPAVFWATGGASFSNWIFERFEITGGGDPVTLPVEGAGIYINDGPEGLEFRYLYIHDNCSTTVGSGKAGGISLNAPGNCIIEYCYIKGNGNPNGDRVSSNGQIAVTSDYRYAQPVTLETAMHSNIYRYNLIDGHSNTGYGSVAAFVHKGMQRLTGYELAETQAGGPTQNHCGIWATGVNYVLNDVIYAASGSVTFGPYYKCVQAHTSDTNNQPVTGANWQSYWIYNDNLPNDTSFREYGDKIHHNIIRNVSLGLRIDQDYCQVYNNIIWLSANNGDQLLVFESKDGFNGGRRGSTKTCFYNNTAYADGGMGVGFSVASRSSDEIYDCLTDGNVAAWGYGYAQNNIIMGAIHGYDSSFLFAEMTGNLNCDPPNPLNPADGHFLFHRNLFFNNEYYDGGKVIRMSNQEYTPSEIDATPASDITWQINSGTLFQGTSGADQYRTISSFLLDGSHTIANGGVGGNHPYLSRAAMPAYIGATNPGNDNWVAGVSGLANISNLQNAPEGNPDWIEDSETQTNTTPPSPPCGLIIR
ncbi:MAG: hypothetical protein A2293_11560 [Elusimicrobia bacterium RIFOXYB2_FULL_49_7]|nr:MAG: hypothetical protein A2293_11560 [Elusimicrobia bacterium RIFOXYB2_FULL_49_7]